MLRRARGHTLVELIVVFMVFSILVTVTATMLVQAHGVYRSTDSSDTAVRELRKARAALERDLVLSAPGLVSRTVVAASLAGGPDGEALWFLSPIDPATGLMVRKEDGSPFWQRNILYYLVVPNNHDATFGMTCNGGAGPNGYEDTCPHKVMVRKVIDANPPTDPTDETTEETLLGSVAGFLDRPTGFGLGALGGAEAQRIVAVSLLGFESTSAPPPNFLVPEIACELRAAATEEAGRVVSVGNVSLFAGPHTRVEAFSLFLRN